MTGSDADSRGALTTLAEGAVNGTGAFLGRICLPAAEEFGYLLRDRVRGWRTANFVKVAQKAEAILAAKHANKAASIPPRLLNTIYEESSWIDDEKLQEMWAGLFAASCVQRERSSATIYMDILSKMGRSEALILNHVCSSCEYQVAGAENLVEPKPLWLTAGAMLSVAELKAFEDVAECLNNLELLGVLRSDAYGDESHHESYDSHEVDPEDWQQVDGGWQDSIELCATNLGFRLYLRAQGVVLRPSEYVKGGRWNSSPKGGR